MDTESLLHESRAEDLTIPLGFRTNVGKEQFQRQLRLLTPKTGLLRRRQQTILDLREKMTSDDEKKLESIFEEVTRIEPAIDCFFKRTDVEKNSYEQLLFSGWPPLQICNTIPFGLLFLAIFKQYIVPGLALLTPLFMVLMPYILLVYVYRLPITTEQYGKILLSMFGLQTFELKNPRMILQGSLTLFSIGQSIYQPIQNALHLQTVHKEMMKKAEAVQQIVNITRVLPTILPSNCNVKDPLADIDYEDTHRVFAFFWDNPYRLKLALQFIGDCEVVYRLAKFRSLQRVKLLEGGVPCLEISNGVDPFLSECIPFALRLKSSHHHAILTGPNRGGKSSVLRSTLISVIFAQSFGLSFGQMKLRPFDWIASGLRLEDRPGSSSLFESEVDFALQILKKAKTETKIGFVLFDELFHSTNPPDGARTADIFLQRLWKTPNVASFISTHVFELAKKSEKHIQKLCVPAHRKQDGSLHFTYTLQNGICEVSSVDEILKEKGLLLPA